MDDFWCDCCRANSAQIRQSSPDSDLGFRAKVLNILQSFLSGLECGTLCSGSEAGSYLKLTDPCITQLKAQRPPRTCNESEEEDTRTHSHTHTLTHAHTHTRTHSHTHKLTHSNTLTLTLTLTHTPCERLMVTFGLQQAGSFYQIGFTSLERHDGPLGEFLN